MTGDVYAATVPECPVHGPMHHRIADPGWYECVGFDGEGCTAKDGRPWVAPLVWRHIGYTDDTVSS